ncbi:PLP-dependent transferase [Hanstruepera ponticola]|uniref:PLP-dependent transferase n=1 Tax=Hanstruepera ponticola TaxID=2042995 RepID=UPI000CF196F1
MEHVKMQTFIKAVLKNMPADWLKLTTHRLDIYDEELAKVEFLRQFELLFENTNTHTKSLEQLPTAYDYIRLGHPLSCVLEWTIAKMHEVTADQVICFSSKSMPVIAVLRENLLTNKRTQFNYIGDLPDFLDSDLLQNVYGFNFELKQVEQVSDVDAFDGSTVFISESDTLCDFDMNASVDFFVNMHNELGSVLLVNHAKNAHYISKVQHVRRRETIAMTPANCMKALKLLVMHTPESTQKGDVKTNKLQVINTIKEITGTRTNALVASSGLSIQYAIVMGLIDHALDEHPNQDIKIIVPPNCYGGTNDQARRVAACKENVEIVDLLVDSGHDMADSLDVILDRLAIENAVPYIIAEIPTNPRVEVPDLVKLQAVLSKERQTTNGETAIAPVFILDQTFCPNTPFLGDADSLSAVKAISYVSGSKFPSGGKCTAGYCVVNKKADTLLGKIAKHLQLCDNEATDLQYEILANQMPSMNKRIEAAYHNTREFVNFIKNTLPDAKINFVSEVLAEQGFTPSVFSLDLPTKGNTDEERESYKRNLNLKLINLMISEIPEESKYCVSYGQLKGCYWTIPATSTQGTTKEGDKDYIARVAISPDMDLERHKKVFLEFIKTFKLGTGKVSM